MKRVAFALALLAAPAWAADLPESVTVQADSLPGLWKVGVPAWFYHAGMELKFGPMQDDFCRMEGARHAVQVYCYIAPFGSDHEGDATLDGNHMHVAFGTMMLRAAVDATQETPGTFTGTFALKLAGIPLPSRSPEQMIARKIGLSEDTHDAGGKSGLLAQLLNDIAQGVPIPPLARLGRSAGAPAAEAVKPLGALQSVIYLGRTPTSAEFLELHKDWPGSRDGWPKGPLPNDDAQSIYAVEFANGERLCGIRQRPDSMVDVLRCV